MAQTKINVRDLLWLELYYILAQIPLQSDIAYVIFLGIYARFISQNPNILRIKAS